VQTFWLDDFLCSKVQLHSCVSLVDCKDFATKLSSVATKETATSATETLGSVSTANSDYPENELLLRQLVYADKILINKIDLIDEASREKSIEYVQDCVTRVNNAAKITVTQYSKIDLDYLIAPIDSYTQVS
jgi:G3E family GTPase